MNEIPINHPRADSLKMRSTIETYRDLGLVAGAGPIAHGRGEAFDYILGEESIPCVKNDINVAAALLVQADNPVISVNGNTAVLAPESLVQLSRAIPAPLEVNVFYGRTREREQKIANFLIEHGAVNVLGITPTDKVPHLTSARAHVDKNGIAAADVVLIPLEDGDRTCALLDWGKKVISIDLNPLSRTACDATVNICDHVVRALPLLSEAMVELHKNPARATSILQTYDKRESRNQVLKYIENRLKTLRSTLR